MMIREDWSTVCMRASVGF